MATLYNASVLDKLPWVLYNQGGLDSGQGAWYALGSSCLGSIPHGARNFQLFGASFEFFQWYWSDLGRTLYKNIIIF